MSDALKDFIQNNYEGFKEHPSDDLWKKIDTTLKDEKIIYKSKNISAMLKYGFGASVIIAGTFVIMYMQKEKTATYKISDKIDKEINVNRQADPKTTSTVVIVEPTKKTKKHTGKMLPVLETHYADTLKINPVDSYSPTILYAAHPPVMDTLDITNWPSAGSQRKKYSVSGDNSTGKTIGCIRSVSKKINGFYTMMQSNVPDKYLGKRVRMTGYMRTENVAEWAGLWMRVGVKGGDEALAFDNMRYGKKDRSVKGTTERTKYDIVLDVPQNSANIIYGVMLVGTGQIYFDSFILEIVDESVPVTGGNPQELKFSKDELSKSYNPRNFWRWYVQRRTISKDGTSNIDLEPNDF